MKFLKPATIKIFSLLFVVVVLAGCTQTPSTQLTSDSGTLIGTSVNPPDKDKTIDNGKYSIRLVDFRESGDVGIAVLEVLNNQKASDFFSSNFYAKLTSSELKYDAYSQPAFPVYKLDSAYKYAEGVNFQKVAIAPSAKMKGEVPFTVTDSPNRLFLIVTNLTNEEVGRFRIK